MKGLKHLRFILWYAERVFPTSKNFSSDLRKSQVTLVVTGWVRTQGPPGQLTPWPYPSLHSLRLSVIHRPQVRWSYFCNFWYRLIGVLLRILRFLCRVVTMTNNFLENLLIPTVCYNTCRNLLGMFYWLFKNTEFLCVLDFVDLFCRIVAVSRLKSKKVK